MELKEKECSALKDAAQASETKLAAVVAEKEGLDGRMAAAEEELKKKDEEMAALTSLHEEAMRAKDDAHDNTLRTRADVHAAEMASLTSHNARHI